MDQIQVIQYRIHIPQSGLKEAGIIAHPLTAASRFFPRLPGICPSPSQDPFPFWHGENVMLCGLEELMQVDPRMYPLHLDALLTSPMAAAGANTKQQ